MKRWTVLIVTIAAVSLVVLGCTRSGNPVAPSTEGRDLTAPSNQSSLSRTVLWGYYDVTIDIATQTVEAIPNREMMFAANVVQFLNGKPSNLSFHIDGTTLGATYTDVDIDVSITHPFPGLTQYNGYDVRGIFLGDGAGKMTYSSKLKYAVQILDQYMMADPDDAYGYGRPDGYTRWFNRTEFYNEGLFGYTPGLYASAGYKPTATLAPYKYFADGIGPDDFIWPSIINNQGDHSVFSAGTTNARNYYLRFPNNKGIKFAYAVVANWESVTQHPSNAIEAVLADIHVTDDVWYLNEQYNGGEIILDFSVWDWDAHVNSVGAMDEYRILVQSSVLGSVHEFTPSEMTPTGSGAHYYTYHAEIPADKVEYVDENEFWVIVEYPDCNYNNTWGVPNGVGFAPLAAFFRQDLNVADYPINEDPVCDLVIDAKNPMPYQSFTPAVVVFDATGTYDPDPKDILTYEWDFDGDGVYNESPDDDYVGSPNKPAHLYYSDTACDVSVRVTDGNTGEAVCSIPVDIATHPSKNIQLRAGVTAGDFAIDPTTGDLLVVYSDYSVYKYTRSSFFATGSQFIWTPSYIVPNRIDVGPNQYSIVGGTYYTTYMTSTIYNASGSQVAYIWLNYLWTACDVIAMGESGTYSYDMGFAHGYTQAGIKYNRVARWADPLYSTYYTHQNTYTESNYFGYNKIFYDFVRGCESDSDDDTIWYVEDQDYYASRWRLGSATDLTYDNAYFGTGAQTDSDSGFHDPKDITRDDQNRLFVLDKLSTTAPKVKVWTVSGDTTASIGSFGDATLISGDPLRIEGGDFNGDIVVLHGNAAPYMISVFQPGEMPGYTP